jgi:tRNA threonylcarbamoyladenosine biosynthesis protein TsaB
MNLLLINAGDKNTFAAFAENGRLDISYASDFKASDPSGKQPDKLIHCVNRIAETYELSSIKAIAVTIGPGSFTGIRVGLSLAKGLAFGLDKPIIPIDNFRLTLGRLPAIDPELEYCVLIPAKLPEYYFSLIKNGKTMLSGCTFLDNLNEITQNKPVIVGDFDDETSLKHCYFTYINVRNHKSEADSMLELAIEMFNNGDLSNPSKIEPLYLKDFSFTKNDNKRN